MVEMRLPLPRCTFTIASRGEIGRSKRRGTNLSSRRIYRSYQTHEGHKRLEQKKGGDTQLVNEKVERERSPTFALSRSRQAEHFELPALGLLGEESIRNLEGRNGP